MRQSSKVFIDFAWFRVRAGYKVVPATKGTRTTIIGAAGSPARIVPLGGTLDVYCPFEAFDALYLQFAKVRDAQELHEFVRKFGPITERGFSDHGDVIRDALSQAKEMQRLLATLGRGNATERFRRAGIAKAQLRPIEASIVPDPDTGRVRLAMKPKALLDGMWIQLANAMSGGSVVKRCRQCNDWFDVGPGTGRRADAEFCKTAHKIAFFSLERSRLSGPKKRSASKNARKKSS